MTPGKQNEEDRLRKLAFPEFILDLDFARSLDIIMARPCAVCDCGKHQIVGRFFHKLETIVPKETAVVIGLVEPKDISQRMVDIREFIDSGSVARFASLHQRREENDNSPDDANECSEKETLNPDDDSTRSQNDDQDEMNKIPYYQDLSIHIIDDDFYLSSKNFCFTIPLANQIVRGPAEPSFDLDESETVFTESGSGNASLDPSATEVYLKTRTYLEEMRTGCYEIHFQPVDSEKENCLFYRSNENGKMVKNFNIPKGAIEKVRLLLRKRYGLEKEKANEGDNSSPELCDDNWSILIRKVNNENELHIKGYGEFFFSMPLGKNLDILEEYSTEIIEMETLTEVCQEDLPYRLSLKTSIYRGKKLVTFYDINLECLKSGEEFMIFSRTNKYYKGLNVFNTIDIPKGSIEKVHLLLRKHYGTESESDSNSSESGLKFYQPPFNFEHVQNGTGHWSVL